MAGPSVGVPPVSAVPPSPAPPPSISARLAGLSATGASRPAGDSARPSLPKLYSRGLLQQYYEQSKAYDERRQGKSAQAANLDAMRGPLNTIEPPFDVDALTTMLFDAPDFFAIVSRLAIDTCGMGWRLVDAEIPAGAPAPTPSPAATDTDDPTETTEPEGAPGDGGAPPAPSAPVVRPIARAAPDYGHLEPVRNEGERDSEAVRQEAEAQKLLSGIASDVAGNRLTLEEMGRAVIMDYDSVGHGGFEVVREGQAIVGLVHVPGRLIRKRADGKGWAQLDDSGRQVAFFRDWGSDQADPNSRIDKDEANRSQNQREVGELKSELYVVRHYHPGELHYGVPPIIPALMAVVGNKFVAERNLRYFTNRGVPDYRVDIKADSTTLNDEEGSRTIDKFMDAIDEHMQFQIRGDDYKTLKNRIPRDMMEVEWEKLSVDFNGSDFQQYYTANRDTQLRMYGMLPHRLGIIETASLGTGSGETQTETYKRSQIDPRQRLLEEPVDAVLDSHGWTAVRFKFNEIDILDEQREIGMLAQGAATGAPTLNELRAWMSRIVQDQDFADYDDDQADIPLRLLDQAAAETMGAAGPFGGFGGGPSAAAAETAEAPASPQPPQLPLPFAAGRQQLSVDPRYRALHRRMAETLRRRGREALAAARGDSNGDGA